MENMLYSGICMNGIDVIVCLFQVRDKLSNEVPYDDWIVREDLENISEAEACRNPKDVANPLTTTTTTATITTESPNKSSTNESNKIK